MRYAKGLIAAAGLWVAGAAGADNPLSVHVLNTQNGLPSAGVEVTLDRRQDGQWQSVSSGTTDAQGRINGLYPKGQPLVEGVYRVVFETGEWFDRRNMDSFFPRIPVVVRMDGELEHYHVPLLLSPYGYSTYRGN